MAKKSAKVANITLNAVALEPYTKNASLDFTQQLPDVACLSDLGPRVVVGNYGYSLSLDGDADFASGTQDATVYGFIGASTAKTLGFDPTGSSTAGADDPHYDATDVCLASYSIRSAVGAGVSWSAQFQGNSSMARVVA